MFISSGMTKVFGNENECCIFNDVDKKPNRYALLFFAASFSEMSICHYGCYTTVLISQEVQVNKVVKLARYFLKIFGFKFKKEYTYTKKYSYGSMAARVFNFGHPYSSQKISTKGNQNEVDIRCMWFIDGF
jgi:hypothetical protein